MTQNPDWLAFQRFLESGVPMDVTSSPLLEVLQCKLLTAAEHSVTLGFEPPAMFQQGAGVVQGGIVAALLDFGMAFASFRHIDEGQSAVTAMLSTQFLAGVGAGPLTVTGRVTKAGRRLIHCTAELVQNDRITATATSSLLVV